MGSGIHDPNREPEEDEEFDEENEDTLSSSSSDSDEGEITIPDESKISKILSDKTIKTVVVLVLVMLFSTQITQPETYLETVTVHE